MESSNEDLILKKVVNILRNENNTMNFNSSLIENVVDYIEEKIGDANMNDLDKFSGERYSDLKCDFSDIVGLESAKKQLYEQVVLQLSLPEIIRNYYFRGIRSGASNVLLFGPPGTGKTILARAVAYEASATLFTCSPSSILSKYQGESESRLKEVFYQAATIEGPAVIFFDEFDSIALERGSADDNLIARRILSELLVLLTSRNRATSSKSSSSQKETSNYNNALVATHNTNSIGSVTPKKRCYNSTLISSYSLQSSTSSPPSSTSSYVVIAATNRVNDLDEAILRRFPLKILVENPNTASRKHLIIHFLEDIEWSINDDELRDLAETTQGWTGSEIESLCRDAAMAPLRSLDFSNGQATKIPLRPVVYQDFISSFSSLLVENEPGHEQGPETIHEGDNTESVICSGESYNTDDNDNIPVN